MKVMTIGEKIKELRGSRPQDACAKACGITRAAWNMYEHDARVPRDEIKIRVARFLGTTVGDLFFNAE